MQHSEYDAAMAAAIEVDEEALVREMIADMTLPPGVKLKRIDQGEDSTGEPAMRLYFTSSRAFGVSPKRLQLLSEVRSELQEKIFAAKLKKWPFVHFLETK